MINDTLHKLEDRLACSEQLSPENRIALESIVAELRREIAEISDKEQAESIVGFSDASTREALRQSPDNTLVDLSLAGLRRSVHAFEISHPRLTAVVNQLCNQLSDLGI
jgi:hypothetical protein